MNNFQYVTTSVPGPNTDREEWEILAGCECTGDNYSADGLLLDKPSGAPILECHSECSCSMLETPCRNRVVQLGVKVAMKVYACADGKGFGVRAAEEIRPHTFICEYAGEVLDKEEVEKRAVSKHDHNYTMTVREHGESGVTTTFIDPRHRGNLGRFINHGCDPNLSIVIIRIGYTVPHVALFSNKTIHIGEELCYDYGASALNDGKGKKCLCGSAICRGYLPMSATASE
ncbi:unnamed protein product [Cylicostephanus goldi]|uniref:Histone-lysine N-methyltransferase n=1 Tax=Cylicostephanus goldi TaxID=71465 RepID=A0A3P7MD51_CYLGO|nr:unnamed protein product [Cylicostephanus goldi]